MKTPFKQLLLVFIGLLFCLVLSQCSTLDKIAPEYHGVDPKAATFVKEFKELAKEQGIVFKHQVTLGFKILDSGDVIGVCNTGRGWAEIDIDRIFWETSSTISKYSLVWHEMGHCACGRSHDHNGKDYPDIKELEKLTRNSELDPSMYYPDRCPRSIMFPIILDDNCFLSHYSDYSIELFQNCDPF